MVDEQLVFALLVVVVVVAGLVAIAALIINAVVKVKLAKYNSIQPAARQDGIWPPAPSVMQLAEPTPARPSPIRSNPLADTLPKREGEEQIQD